MLSRSHAVQLARTRRARSARRRPGSRRERSPRSGRRAPTRGGRSGSSRSCRPTSASPAARRASRSGTGMPMSSSKRAFHASGRSSTASRPEISCCSSSKRRMMWRPYVVSSASTRMYERRARFTARWKRSSGTPPSAVGERLLHARVEPAPERQRAPDDVLPQAALRLVQSGRDAGAERRSLERRAHSPLVQAVAALVHRGEEREEVVLRVARRQADVAEPEGHLVRVDGRVQPKLDSRSRRSAR